jgi:hypothetical protein
LPRRSFGALGARGVARSASLPIIDRGRRTVYQALRSTVARRLLLVRTMSDFTTITEHLVDVHGGLGWPSWPQGLFGLYTINGARQAIQGATNGPTYGAYRFTDEQNKVQAMSCRQLGLVGDFACRDQGPAFTPRLPATP